MAKRTDRLAEALYDKLREWATAKRWRGTTLKEVPINEVRRCFHAVYQRREGDDAATAMLRASLSVLAERAQIVPVRATDSERIALPRRSSSCP